MLDKLKYWHWLLIAIFFIFFVNLDVIYVNIMEARNFITAREMVNLHHWLLTTMNNLQRYEKPPLPTWLTAISGAVFGFKSLIAMRLPAALSSVLLIWFFYKFVPLLQVTKKQAFLSALVLATSFYIIFSGRNGQWDIFTHAFMMVSMYFLWKFFSHDKNLYKNAILSAVFFGFAFMSKGPVSLYALWLPFLISYGVVYKFKNFKTRWKPLILFLLIGFGIGLWWFVYVRLADPKPFIEIASQESSRWGSYNIRPFWYYWSFFTQSGVWTIPAFVGLLYPYLKNKVSNKKAYLFAFLWTVFSVVLLSVIPEKKSRYLLPVLIPLALNTGFYIEYLFRRFKEMPKKETWVVYFNHGLIAFIGLAFPLAGYFILNLHGSFWVWYVLASIALFGLGLAMVYFLRKKNYPKTFYMTIAFIGAVMTFGFPLTNALLDNPNFNNISNLRKRSEKEGFPVYEYGGFTPELIWEYGEPIPELDDGKLKLPKTKRFGIIATEHNAKKIIKTLKPDYKILDERRYDLNYVNPEKSGYKSRLIRKFYLVAPLNPPKRGK